MLDSEIRETLEASANRTLRSALLSSKYFSTFPGLHSASLRRKCPASFLAKACLVLVLVFTGCSSAKHRAPEITASASGGSDVLHADIKMPLFTMSSPMGANVVSVALIDDKIFAVTEDEELWQGVKLGAEWQRVDLAGIPADSVVSRVAATTSTLFVLAHRRGLEYMTIYHRSPSELHWRQMSSPENSACTVLIADVNEAYAVCRHVLFSLGKQGDKWRALSGKIDGDLVSAVLTNDSLTITRGAQVGEDDRWRFERAFEVRRTASVNAFANDSVQVFLTDDGLTNSLPSLSSLHFDDWQGKFISIAAVSGTKLVSDEEGIWISARGQTGFDPVDTSIARLPIVSVKIVPGIWFVRTGHSLFWSSTQGASWKRSRARDFVESDPVLRRPELFALTRSRDSTHVLTVSRDDGKTWSVSQPLLSVDDLCLGADEALFASGKGKIYVSHRVGENFIAWNEGLPAWTYPSKVHLTCAGDTVFAHLPDSGLYQRSITDSAWRRRTLFDDMGFRSMRAFGSHLYFLSAGGDLYRIPVSGRSDWTRLVARGVKKYGLTDIWVDPNNSDVMFLVGPHSLFWSNDGGSSFTLEKIASLSPSLAWNGQTFLLATDDGLNKLEDHIPRLVTTAAIASLIKQHIEVLLVATLMTVIFALFSTRLILIMLQLNVPLVRDVASSFYLTNYGRWRLFRRYRRNIIRMPEIQSVGQHYVELSYKVNTGTRPSTVEQLLHSIKARPRVTILGQGGAGKSTLALKFVELAAKGKFRVGRKRLEPVLVEGFSCSGDLFKSVSDSLKRRGAYINESILTAQLEMGNLLIVFDGYSEMPASAEMRNSPNDLTSFVSRYRDSEYVFTSRSELPPDLAAALGPCIEIRLGELDERAKIAFLELHLRNKGATERILAEIKLRVPQLPLTPLMMRLIAHYYNENGTVVGDKAALFADYMRDVLAPKKIGVKDTAGIHYAIEFIVSRNHLKTCGDRGFIFDDAVKLLIDISEILKKGYEIQLGASSLLRVLEKAGVFKSSGSVWRFAHDSFESYYAGRVLEKDYRRRKYDLIQMAFNTSRLNESIEFLSQLLTENERSGLPALLKSKASDAASVSQS